ncbi:MAG TPA: cytochrome C oxidase subunit IV family protein [Candidatus Binataceae bacterium]|nr:cytochrome C oxidase subunit IV family protein [Candidatus Binataceae bacterium]
MSEVTQTAGVLEPHGRVAEAEAHHPGAVIYVIVAAFLAVLTAMEITVFYVPALKAVVVPVLLVLAAAKFALIALFFMHLKYDSWVLSAFFLFGLLIAFVLLFAMMMLFAYLTHHRD